jgi:hypothetical protein
VPAEAFADRPDNTFHSALLPLFEKLENNLKSKRFSKIKKKPVL